jgi:hypothetical protein
MAMNEPGASFCFFDQYLIVQLFKNASKVLGTSLSSEMLTSLQ